MARRIELSFSEESLGILSSERYAHPDPRVQRRMEVLWLIGRGETQVRAGELAGVSTATVERYVAIYRAAGVAGLGEFHWAMPRSVLEDHRPTLEETFRENPPHTVSEACRRIEELTGVRRGETQVRRFLKKCWA